MAKLFSLSENFSYTPIFRHCFNIADCQSLNTHNEYLAYYLFTQLLCLDQEFISYY